MRGPLVRAEQDRHGLTGLRASISAARQELHAAQTRAGELTATTKRLGPELKRLEAELRTVTAATDALPAADMEIIFELGEASAEVMTFEFMVGRRGLTRRPGEELNAEAALWARPRRVRVWADNPGTALAAARSRFPEIDGYWLRTTGG